MFCFFGGGGGGTEHFSTFCFNQALQTSVVYLFLHTGPPSPPRDLVYTLKQSTLILEWAAPNDSGGRGDLTYSIGCRRCVGPPRAPQVQCEPCGASVGFVPQQSGLTECTVTVVNLLPNSNYSFSVEARNGVSELLPNKRFYTQVNISTSLPGMFFIKNLPSIVPCFSNKANKVHQ